MLHLISNLISPKEEEHKFQFKCIIPVIIIKIFDQTQCTLFMCYLYNVKFLVTTGITQ